ncbi:MAG: sugar O-acyltransferase [Clostridiaceae bacterium]
MKDLIIVGGGGMARKIIAKVKKINQHAPTWNILGMLDDNPHSMDGVRCDYAVIGSIKDYIPRTSDHFVMGVSDPCLKEKLAGIMKAKGVTFETLIGPEADLGDDVTFGEGCIIFTPHVIDSGATFGDFVTVMASTISFDAQIGDFCTLTGFANTTTATLGKRVYVGSHAVILENLTVGDDSHIGAGSIVVKDVPERVKVFGVPARIIEKK